MKELKGTKTEKNLQEAFAGESQARNKYSYWAGTWVWVPVFMAIFLLYS